MGCYKGEVAFLREFLVSGGEHEIIEGFERKRERWF